MQIGFGNRMNGRIIIIYIIQIFEYSIVVFEETLRTKLFLETKVNGNANSTTEIIIIININ